MCRKVKDKTFEYGGYHFVPVTSYDHSDSGFRQVTSRLKTDHELGFHAVDYYGTKKFPYDYEGFYQAAGGKTCDIFRCVENGKLYIPCDFELQQYIEPHEKRRNDYVR